MPFGPIPYAQSPLTNSLDFLCNLQLEAYKPFLDRKTFFWQFLGRGLYELFDQPIFRKAKNSRK